MCFSCSSAQKKVASPSFLETVLLETVFLTFSAQKKVVFSFFSAQNEFLRSSAQKKVVFHVFLFFPKKMVFSVLLLKKTCFSVFHEKRRNFTKFLENLFCSKKKWFLSSPGQKKLFREVAREKSFSPEKSDFLFKKKRLLRKSPLAQKQCFSLACFAQLREVL